MSIDPDLSAGRSRAAILLALLAGVPTVSGVGCAGSGGQTIEALPSRDVRVVGASGGSGGQQGYDYVARRSLAVVALAEARGIERDVARAAVDHLADTLDTCATEQARKGSPVDGAARVVMMIENDGTVGGANLRVDPGAGTAQVAALCLLAPAKMMTFPALSTGTGTGTSTSTSTSTSRGLAIEALWGHVTTRQPQ